MAPRAYNLGKRKAATEETRGRIIEAARRILGAPDGVSAFTVEAVAREAGVARMTVYYQYGSKAALLDAIYDDLAARGLMSALQPVISAPDAASAFVALVGAFTSFWEADRVITRRLRALARLDPIIEQGIRERDVWRRSHFTRALERLAGPDTPPAVRADLIETVLVTTSFETYDQLADAGGPAEAARLILWLVKAQLAYAGVGLPALPLED